MPATTRIPARRRAALASLAVGVVSLAGAGSAAAMPLSEVLPGLGVTPPAGAVTTPGASVTTPGVALGPAAIESIRLPEIAAKVKAAVVAHVRAAFPSVDLPTASTPPVGSAVVRAPGGRAILATPRVGSMTTPRRTPARAATVKATVKVAAKAKVKLPRTPRVVTPPVIVPAKTVAVAPKLLTF